MSETLPKGWNATDLDNLCSIRTGKLDVNAGHPDGKYPFFTCAQETYRIDNYAFEGKSILVAGNGYFNVKYYDGRFNAYQRTYVLQDFQIDDKYLYFYTNYSLDSITKENRGSTVKYIRIGDLANHIVPIPPLNEQKRIVAKLDAIIPRIDSLKTRMEKIPILIKRFRQSVLTAAVTGKLTEKWREEHLKVASAEVLLTSSNFKINTDFKEIEGIPDKWCWCALGNYAQLSRGRFSIRPRNDPQYYTGSYPFIQIGDLPKEGGYVNEHKQTLNEKGLKVSKEFEKETIAIAIVGATIGNTGILSYKMCFPDSLIGIVTKTKVTSLYTEYYLRTEKENFRNIAYSSGGQPNIKLPTLTDYPFPLPPLEEQKEIVRQVENLFALADKLEAHYQKAKSRIDKLSQSVLAKAFRGELVPQDPHDEPGEKLLERIMAEKAKMESALKGAKKKGGGQKAKAGSRK